MRSYNWFLLLAVFTVVSCISKQIGYFEVSPYTHISSDKINQPLYIKVSSRIEDHFTIKNLGIETKVSSFRMSLMYACKKAFTDVFSETRMYMEGDQGFRLEIQHFEPTWVIEDSKSDSVYNDVYCHINYGCTLYRDDTYISSSGGKVRIKYGDNSIFNIETLFKETVKLAVADMAQNLYKK
jgi:hypothetical protein